MKNVIDFSNSTKMLNYFSAWRAKGRCIYGAYRFLGKKADYYITNVNSHATDFVVFVIPCGQRFSLTCEKILIVGSFLCVLQFLHHRDLDSVKYVSNAVSSGDDLAF